jgi:hypothetical protein
MNLIPSTSNEARLDRTTVEQTSGLPVAKPPVSLLGQASGGRPALQGGSLPPPPVRKTWS